MKIYPQCASCRHNLGYCALGRLQLFHDAITCDGYKKMGMFRHLFSSDGRIGKREYCYSWLKAISIFFLILVLLYVELIITSAFDLPCPLFVLGDLYGRVQGTLYGVFVGVPLMCQSIRRCHDCGKSGWYLLIPFWFIYMFFASGKDSEK